MADNASLARPYAKALFSLAAESDAFDAWSGAVTRFASIASDESFSALVADPRVADSQLVDLLLELAGDDAPAGSDNFIKLLVANNRVETLPDIAEQYIDLVAKAQATVKSQVTTAMPLSEQQRADLTAALEARLGMKIELEETVDTELIGGAVVKAGDLVIDGSARGRLAKLGSALA